MNPASRAQLRYLKNLGYVDDAPQTTGEASAAIDALLEGRDLPAAHAAILEERRLTEEETRREEEEAERQDAIDDLNDDLQLERDLAAIDGRKPDLERVRAAHAEKRAARHSSVVGEAPRRRSVTGSIIIAPLLVIRGIGAGVLWTVSRLIGLVGWLILQSVRLLIFVLSRTGVLAGRSVALTAQVGREKVVPWIGARDWRRMAAGVRAQLVAAIRHIDALLAAASGGDRTLLLILRFAVAAGIALITAALLLWMV